MILKIVFLAFGLLFLVFGGQMGAAVARRHLVYDHPWFYRYAFRSMGFVLFAFGVANLLGWIR